MAKRGSPTRTQYQIKTEPPSRFLTAVPRFEWRTPWSTPPTQMGPKSLQRGAAHIAGTGVTEAPTRFLTAVPRFEWRQPWSTPPTRMGPINRMVGAALIAATGLFAPVFTPPATTNIGWLSPLSTPTPANRGLPTHQQQTIAFTPENFPSCGLVGVDTEGAGLVGGSSVNTIDYTGITVGDGPNRALVAMMTTDTLTTGLTAVWDQGGTNQTMTLIGSDNFFGQTIGIFGLRNPVGGNNTLRFSWTTAGIPTVTAISLLTVDQSSDASAFKNFQSNSGNVSSLSVTVPSKPGDLVVGIGGVAGPTVTAVGNNSIYIDNTSVGDHSGAGWNVGAPSVTFTGTSSTSGNWLLTAINVSAYPCPIDTDFILPLSEVPRRKAALHPSLQDASTPDVFQSTEVVTVDKWFDALSGPAGIKPGLNTALQAAYTTEYFPDTVNANAGQWFGSLAEPLRAKSRFAALQVAFTGEYYPDTFTQWFTPLSEPTRIDRSLTATDQSAVPYVVTEVVTVDKWFDALSEPVRVRSRFSALQAVFTIGYSPDTIGQWFNPLSEPTRTKRSLNALDQSWVPFVSTETVTLDKWFDAFSEPVRVQSRFGATQQAYTSGYVSFEIVTVDKWFDPLSEPVRTRPALRAALQPATTYDAKLFPDPANFLEGWFAPYSEPVRQLQGLKAGLQSFYATSWVLETVSIDKWFDALSEPVRTRPALLAALQSVSTQDTVFIPDPSRYMEGWFGGLAEPVQQKAGLRAAQQPDHTEGPLATTEVVTVDKWYAALSLPVRQKLGLITALQSTYTSGYLSFETVTVDKWFASISDPKRFRPALHVSLQQTLTQDTVFIPSPSQYQGWYGALSEPQRQQAGLKAAQQVPYYSVPVTTTETITIDKWFSSLSSPTKPKPGDYDHYKGENEFTAIAANMKWFTPLTEPVLQKRGLSVVNQTAYFAYPGVIAGEIITVDKWFKSFEDPVRAKHPADDRYQGENNWEAIAASMEWFAPFTEPVRFKPGLVPATRPPFFASPAVIIIPSLASWWQPLSDPPKAKVSLGTHLQRAFTQDPKLFPNPARFLEGWYNWWSEPVRHLAQLNAALQRSWTASDRRPVLATITVTMAVTEVNDDAALFAVKVFPYNQPATAVVSLVEIGHGASLTSLVEEANIGISGGAPIILSVSPQFGAPGTLITITGRNFTSVTSVTIDGLAASFTIVDDSTILATVP